MEENRQHFGILCFIISRKVKAFWNTEMQNWNAKKICAACGEGAVMDQKCQVWFAKFRAGDFSLDDAPQLGRLVQVDSDQTDINREQSTFCHAGDSWYTQNTEINKVIGKNGRCVFYVTEKTKQTFWPTQYITQQCEFVHSNDIHFIKKPFF